MKMLTRTGKYLHLMKPVLIILVLSFGSVNAQNVTGTVLDEENQPVNGATVIVKGTNKATITNSTGNFSINAAGKDVLVFSFVGFTVIEVPVNERKTISVTMTRGESNMQEVVITALGIKRETKKLGYATTSVNADELIKQRTTNIGESLEGKVAG